VAFAYGVASKRATKHAVEAPPSEAMELFIIRVHMINYMFSMYVYMIKYIYVCVCTYSHMRNYVYIYTRFADVFIYKYVRNSVQVPQVQSDQLQRGVIFSPLSKTWAKQEMPPFSC
jgi:hypothetical protein